MTIQTGAYDAEQIPEMTAGRSITIVLLFQCVCLFDASGGAIVSIRNESGSDMRLVSVGLLGSGDEMLTPYCLGSIESGQQSKWFVFTDPTIDLLSSVVYLTQNEAVRLIPPQSTTPDIPDQWSYFPITTAAYVITIRSDYRMEIEQIRNPILQEMKLEIPVVGLMLAFSNSTDIEFGFRNKRASDDIEVLQLLEDRFEFPDLTGTSGLSITEGLIYLATFRLGWFSALIESGYDLEPQGGVDIDSVLYEITSDYSIIPGVRRAAHSAYIRGRSDALKLLSGLEATN